MAIDMQAEVARFHKVFGQEAYTVPTKIEPELKLARVSWMMEELTEYMKADNIVDEADALVDILYFLLGTADIQGIKLEPIFDIVHNANMSKVWPDGTVQRDEQGKIRKPPGWIKPEPLIEAEINEQLRGWWYGK